MRRRAAPYAHTSRTGKADCACAAACVPRSQSPFRTEGMKPLRVKIFKGVLLFEMVGLLGAYFLYYRMDKNQDFRHKMNMRFPSVLELYYKSNEWAGIHGIREKDQLKWLSSKN
nr:protein CEBPZOS isoform X2 [Pelodiscus sinensis]|eukprot:XP_025046608.1 protein CEBPZOS isoform X2 [Pelodiscus sinensis]